MFKYNKKVNLNTPSTSDNVLSIRHDQKTGATTTSYYTWKNNWLSVRISTYGPDYREQMANGLAEAFVLEAELAPFAYVSLLETRLESWLPTLDQ